MISIKGLIFEYPGVRALDNISLDIPQGEITALVGPNGAGKTTLMRCISALETPLSGTITIGDVNVLEHPRECHKKIGYLEDFFGLYEELTVKQCLSYFAKAQLIAKDKQKDAVNHAAVRLEISDRFDDKAGTLSRGLKQRLAIAQSIIHEPEFIILDEPASGLDPGARHSLSQLFIELKKQGMTLLISSHILSELEEYSDHMVIVSDGKIKQHTDLGKLQEQGVQIKLTTLNQHDNVEAILMEFGGISELTQNNKTISFKYDASAEKHHELIKYLIAHDISLTSFEQDKLNLQQTYMAQVSSSESKA